MSNNEDDGYNFTFATSSTYKPKQVNPTLKTLLPISTVRNVDKPNNNDKAQNNAPAQRVISMTSQNNSTKQSLLQEMTQQNAQPKLDEAALNKLQEEHLMKSIVNRMAGLQSREEVAGKGQQVVGEPIETGWTPPNILQQQTEDQWQATRLKYNIAVNGQDVPPAVESFKMMRVPQPIIDCLQKQGIQAPKPIQMQGCTVALSGRDMIGIAQTGGGKTLVFALPLVTLALREEIKRPYAQKEGPFGLVLVPQRELAEQINNFIEDLCLAVQKANCGILTTILAIGGITMSDQWMKLAPGRGFHILVGTPGKCAELIKKSRISLARCKMLCLDEADRLVADTFQADLQTILGGFTAPKQTILFSATMPQSVKILAAQSLRNPITVTVGQAGTTNKDITQDVIWMPEDRKFHALLKVITKTPPPSLIFCNSQSTVDLVYEYCRIKGIEAGCIHSGIDQTNRSKTVEDFKNGDLDVLVATDLLAKGIDFGTQKHIEHVINFDMPAETQFYVHRIGRTGRGGKKGIATTFVNENVKEQILLDLKHLLRDAGQEVPKQLSEIVDPFEGLSAVHEQSAVCNNCGGFGHTILYCPILLKKQRKPQRGKIDAINHNDRV